MKTNLGRTETAVLQNKSGGTLAFGDVCVIDSANAGAVTTTTIVGYTSARICVLLELNGLAADAYGVFAFSGYVPQINLSSSASLGNFVRTHSTSKKGVPHATPLLLGDFAQVLETGTSPSAILLGNVITNEGAGQYFSPSGLTGATQVSRWVGATTSGAPITGTFNSGDWVIDLTGQILVCVSGGTPGTWQAPSPSVAGFLHKVFPANFVATSAFTTAYALAANGGTLAIPMILTAPMLLQSVSIRNTDTTTARTWGWDLYVQSGATNVLSRVAACSANESYTPSAASTRTLDAGSAPVTLGVGLYWLAIQNRHATSTFGIGTTAVSSAFTPNGHQVKTTTNPNDATLDFTAATWTKLNAVVAVALNGRVFGESTAF